MAYRPGGRRRGVSYAHPGTLVACTVYILPSLLPYLGYTIVTTVPEEATSSLQSMVRG